MTDWEPYKTGISELGKDGDPLKLSILSTLRYQLINSRKDWEFHDQAKEYFDRKCKEWFPGLSSEEVYSKILDWEFQDKEDNQ